MLVLVLSLIAFAIANSKGSGAQAIMDMVENAWGAFGASFGPTILLSLFWKRFNYKARSRAWCPASWWISAGC